MADITGIIPGQVLSFKLITSVLPAEFVNVKLLSIAGADMARMVEDVDAIHANILSTLPAGTPANCDQFNFLIVELMDKSKKAVGIPWIEDPIRIVENSEIQVVLRNVSRDDVARVQNALQAYGFTDYEVNLRTSFS